MTCGDVAAAEHAELALGHDGLVAVLPCLQGATLPPLVRAAWRDRHLDLDTLPTELIKQLGAADIELVMVRRVTGKSLLNLGLRAVAAYTLIGMFSGLDLEAFGRSLADANWWWLLAPLSSGSCPASTTRSAPWVPRRKRFRSDRSWRCSSPPARQPRRPQLGRTRRYHDPLLPALRDPPSRRALGRCVVDSASELVVQITLFVLVFFISDIDLELTLSTEQLSGEATTALIVIAALVAAGAIAFAVPSLRQRVLGWLHQAHDALQNRTAKHRRNNTSEHGRFESVHPPRSPGSGRHDRCRRHRGLRTKRRTVDVTAQAIHDQLDALDPVTRGAVIARLTAEAVRDAKAREPGG